MAIAQGFDYDIFVSYAHIDDSAPDGQPGWVTQFVHMLEPALRQRLGGMDTLKVFFASQAVGANFHLPEFISAVKKSALFLGVASPSYATRSWTLQELEAFAKCSTDPSRLFAIEYLPLGSDERYPVPLDDQVRLPFWKTGGAMRKPMALSPTFDAQEFSILVNSLACDIKEKLLQMRYSGGNQPLTPKTVSNDEAPRKKKTILLAQTTDDVEEEADQLRRYLSQYGDEIEIKPKTGYPQGGEAFMAAVKQDLAQADLFVQLLGRRIGRIPPDLPSGYTQFQYDTAKSSGVEIMQWRHPELMLDQIADPAYKSLVSAETVTSSGLEGFKGQVLKCVRKRAQEPRKVPSRSQSPTVFINADDSDLAIAREIERECLRRALPTFLPITGASSEANRKDLAENLTDCDVLLFIYGDTTQDWIRSQLRFFGKVKPRRDADPKLLAICSGPPAPKPDIRMTFPNAHTINCPQGWDMTAIRALLEELAE